MKIAVIGASDVFAGGFATWALDAGHDITFVGFERGQSESLVAKLGAGRAGGPSEPLGNEPIFLALPYVCLRPVLDSYRQQFDGKVIVDLITPVDLDTLEPVHPEPGSSAEEIAKERPRSRVVKAFNPRFSARLFSAEANPQSADILLASDDRDAKRVIAGLFKAGGLHPIDVGPLRRARELEAFGYLHMIAGQPLSSAF
jgi:predicted dinucleotide-binding enzyme